MAKFGVEEILKITKGKLIQGDRNTVFEGVSTDSRTIKEGEIFVALKGNNFDGHNFIKEALEKKAKGTMVEKKFSIESNPKFCIIHVEDTLNSLRELASYHRKKFNIPIIAVTGSNGKTTVKEMISKILSAHFSVLKTPYNYNNQIGLAHTLLEMDTNHEIAVFELGINHYGEMEILSDMVKPKMAIFTNIGKTHLEFLESPLGVLKEKMDLIKDFNEENIVIFNIDDPLLRERFVNSRDIFSLISFGVENEADFKGEKLSFSEEGISFRVKDVDFYLPLIGKHNVYNALCSIAVGSIFDIPLEKMALSLKEFCPPSMRMNLRKVKGEKEFILIDDTYNANPNSVISAIESLSLFKNSGKKILVLGDMLELGKESYNCHREIGLSLKDKDIDIILTFGKHSAVINEMVKNFKNINTALHFDSYSTIIDFLKENIENNDVILIKGSRGMHMEEIVKGISEIEKVSVI